MATIKRTTSTTIGRAPQRTLPSLPEDSAPQRLGGRVDEPGQLPEGPPDNQWPEVPTDPDQEIAEGTTVVTVGEEQLQRSREMQEMGISNWVAAHDERGPDYQQQQVAGVTPLEH
jgi:hypothetical protein